MFSGFHIRIPSNVTALKWLFCFLTAVLVSCVAFTMGLLISGTHTFRQMLIVELHDLDVLDTRGAALLYGIFNASCALVAASCVLYGAMPAAGSGLPELVTMLNGVEVPEFLTLRTFIMKSIGACASVAASLPLGYQGVLLHIGGMVAGILASWLPTFDLTTGAKRAVRAEQGCNGTAASGGDDAANEPATQQPNPRRLQYSMSKVRASPIFSEYLEDNQSAISTSPWQRKLPRIVEGITRRLPGTPRAPRSDHVAAPNTSVACPPTAATGLLDRVHFIASTAIADQVACGAAAGAAAAFNAPIGGMLYLMELSTRWRLELTWRTFFSTSITVLVLKGLTHACRHSTVCSSVKSFLSVSGSSDVEYHFTSPYAQLPLIMAFAAAMGAIGSGFVALNCAIVKLRRRWSDSNTLLLLEAVVFTFIYSICMYGIAAAGDCRPCDPDIPNKCNPGLNSVFASVNCDDDEYNPLATLVASSNGDNIRSLWTVRYEDFSLRALLIFSVVYGLSAAWTAGLAIPSGSFTPTILLGSCLGRTFAHLLRLAGIVEQPDAALFGLLGAAAMFSGQMRMTVSLCVIMLEMCDTQAMLPFLMVVIIVAKGTADRLTDPIVVRRIKLKGLPFIARMPHLSQRRGRLSAADIVRKSDFPLLPREPTGHLIRQLLNQHPSKPLFVVVRMQSSAPSTCAAEPSAVFNAPSAGAPPSIGSPPSWHPAQLTQPQDGVATSWESASTEGGIGVQKHVLLGVVARTTLVKLLAHLEVATALQASYPTSRTASNATAFVAAAMSGTGLGRSPYGSIPEELHSCLTQPLLQRSNTEPSLNQAEDTALLEVAEDQHLLVQQQSQLATAVTDHLSGEAGFNQAQEARSILRRPSSRSTSSAPLQPSRLQPSAFSSFPLEGAAAGLPGRRGNAPAGMALRHQSQSLLRDWVQQHESSQEVGPSPAGGHTDSPSGGDGTRGFSLESDWSPRSEGASSRGDADRHVVDMSAQLPAEPASSTQLFGGFAGNNNGSCGTLEASDTEQMRGAATAAAAAAAWEWREGTRGNVGSQGEGLSRKGSGSEPVDGGGFLDAKIDLSSVVQVPPIQMDPRVSLEAIFSLMNNMAVEIVPIVSTGGVYHGLVTRSCMMRFQRKVSK